MANQKLREDAKAIYTYAIGRSMPEEAVRETLSKLTFGSGRIVIVSTGKAAWPMTKAAVDMLSDRKPTGVMVTKYEHSKGELPGIEICEAAHPVLDENGLKGTEKAIAAVSGLSADDTVLFLLSGGGSALFESTDLTLEELQDVNKQLLACGADIREMNTIRKRLSKVKGGRFAKLCEPARVICIALSDIISGEADMIASGPAIPDPTTCAGALAIAAKYDLNLSDKVMAMLSVETPKELPNAEYYMCGSVSQLCWAAAEKCRELGYEPLILTDRLNCVAKEAGLFLGTVAACHAGDGRKQAFIAGGETVVHLTGKGLGGRNQEIALAAAGEIAGLPNALVFSVGSDGTDGPCDAAGGITDGDTKDVLAAQGIKIENVLRQNDSYHALAKCDGLIMTGATGTNVNDVAVVLLDA